MLLCLVENQEMDKEEPKAELNEILKKYKLENLSNQSHLYSYGHKTINLADNRQVILSTIKFIKETRRLTP